MALGLLFVIVTALTQTGYLSVGGYHICASLDSIALLFLVMAATSLNEFHHSARWQAIACRR